MALTGKEKKLLRYFITRGLPPPMQAQVIASMEQAIAMSDEDIRKALFPFQTAEVTKIDGALEQLSKRIVELNTAKNDITAVEITSIAEVAA